MTTELIFEQRLSDTQTNEMIWGHLLLKREGELKRDFTCTSGQKGWQFSGGVKVQGRGPLPSNKATGEQYHVVTTPIQLDDDGIQGNFYPIKPFTVRVSGVERGDFGIHNDANRLSSPGSAGCIVFWSDYGWQLFQEEMAKLRKAGFTSVPLEVLH